MKALTTAIFGKMTSSTSLYTDIGGRLYKGRAPEGAEYPYVVYMLISDTPEKTFTEHYERVYIQFSLFSASPSSTEIEDMFTHLNALYDECSLSITGSALVWMKRGSAQLMIEDHTVRADPTNKMTVQVWHYAVEYEILTSLN